MRAGVSQLIWLEAQKNPAIEPSFAQKMDEYRGLVRF